MMKPGAIALVTCLLAACAATPQAIPPKVHEDAVKRKVPVAIAAPVKQESSCAEAAAIVNWLRLVGRIEKLSSLELASERDRIFREHHKQPGDGSRLVLGYLLSRPELLVQHLDKSRVFLTEIDTSSAYAPVRDLLLRELAMIDKIADLKTQITRLQSQLDALRVIETDLTENQKEFEEVPQ
jgi:hypothetical protein